MVGLGDDLGNEMRTQAWPCDLAIDYFKSSTNWEQFVAPSTHHKFKLVSEHLDEIRFELRGFRRGIGSVRAVREQRVEDESFQAPKV